jgi:hypothetical protein
MSKDARVPLDLRYSELPDHQSKNIAHCRDRGRLIGMHKNSVYFLFLMLVACSPALEKSRQESCSVECQLKKLLRTKYNTIIASQRLALVTQMARDERLSGYVKSAKNDYMKSTKKGDENFISLVKKKVREGMKDPESTQFKDLNIVRRDGGIWVCGSVNAKNSYGAYTGFEPFFATSLDVDLPLSGGHSDYANEIAISSYREWCSN